MRLTALICLAPGTIMGESAANHHHEEALIEQRVTALLEDMTLAEKVGQMSLVHAGDGYPPESVLAGIRSGRVGGVLNQVNVDIVNALQRMAVEETRLGIPLLTGRDVIHGFKTIMPIPLGQAASWNPELVREGARIAAQEASAAGINWTFAPMLDVTRDPRWGRIAESPGEDPYLAGVLAAAMVRGFQGEDMAAPGSLAACAKHFAGYGAVESGRDYATTNVPENELRNVYLPPFRAAVNAGVASVMASFSDLDGVPATGNDFLMRQILREEWGFRNFVVSDWNSVPQLAIHGLTEGDRDSARAAVAAGIDMEMASHTFEAHLAALVNNGQLDVSLLDTAVARILRIKLRLGLFENPYTDPEALPEPGNERALAVARQLATQSLVLLKNDGELLPLSAGEIRKLAVIGPLADDPYEQLGTWVFDGDPTMSVTGLQAIRELAGEQVEVSFEKALATSRSRDTSAFANAARLAAESDAVVLILGEEAILSGEAHSRADISLPGAQEELVRVVGEAGKPVIAVIMAGRPLTLGNILDKVDAVLYAWHPGTMGGAAIADVLFGRESPSGKLPVTFPRMVGQVPIYYSQKNTGKPPSPDTVIHMDDIEVRAPQTSFGMTAYHLDAGYTPQFPFGYGLSYARFEYSELDVSPREMAVDGSLAVSAKVTNTGKRAADEVVQLYVRDLVGSVTRPVKELKGFRRVRLAPGESRTVTFQLDADALAFYGRRNTRVVEPGAFHVWVGGSSDALLRGEFLIRAQP